VLGWFKVFCGFMGLFHLLLVPLPLVLFNQPGLDFSPDERFEVLFLSAISLPLSLLFWFGIVWDYKPWHWIYGIVRIGLTPVAAVSPFPSLCSFAGSSPR
ncbi:MAG: hypothetical protein VX969_03070, partial [Verrucomicrobiota bacterium]|nr:hypothetical protein [Verrucomicrobiota bacterium]